MSLSAPDLTQRPPRSMRVRLGGYVILPRMLDKCRAELVGKNGVFHYNCPLDRHLIQFLGIDPEPLKAEVATGKGDGAILEWIQANSQHERAAWEIAQWSDFQERRGPDSDSETLAYFVKALGEFTSTRSDIRTWADLLDLDDHCTFGGQP